MPVAQGNRPSVAFANINKKQRTEITDELLPKLKHVADLMRNANSILVSASFHVDSRQMSSGIYKDYYKVDIQLKTGPTVAEIMLSPQASSVSDTRRGFELCLGDGFIYIVT